MRVLALDTTTSAGSIALVEGDRVLIERSGDRARTHAERLPRELLEALEAGGLGLRDVDLFAIAVGPGSFTGLRIGISTIQGLAFVTGRPVVGVSVLETLGHLAGRAEAPGTVVGGWVDAHRGEVYAARYRVGPGKAYEVDRLVEIEPACVGRPARIAEDWAKDAASPLVIAGDGAVTYRDIIREHGDARVLEAPCLAAALGRVAHARAVAGLGVAASAIQPIYIRRPDAEIARDQRLDARVDR